MNNNTSPKSISPAEWEVMKVLWQHGKLAARDVFAALPKDADWAYKTVKTLLSRLVAKEAITYDQIGNSYLYRAVADEMELSREEVRTVFGRIARGSLSPVLAHFIDETDLSDDEIKQLLEKLNEKKQERQDDGSEGEPT